MGELYGADNYLTGLAGYASSATPYLSGFSTATAPMINSLPTDAMANVVGAVAEEGTDIAGNIAAGLMKGSALNATAQQIAAGVVPKVEPTGWFDTLKGFGSDTMKYFNDNSKGIESGTKLLGGLGTWYNQQQTAGLAKQALSDQRANTAYNRARQAQGDKTLQEASDRVFGTGAI